MSDESSFPTHDDLLAENARLKDDLRRLRDATRRLRARYDELKAGESPGSAAPGLSAAPGMVPGMDAETLAGELAPLKDDLSGAVDELRLGRERLEALWQRAWEITRRLEQMELFEAVEEKGPAGVLAADAELSADTPPGIESDAAQEARALRRLARRPGGRQIRAMHDLNRRIARLEAENAELRAHLDEQQPVRALLMERVERLDREREELWAQRDSLQARVSALAAACDAQADELNRLRERDAEREELAARLDEVRRERDRLKEWFEAHQQEPDQADGDAQAAELRYQMARDRETRLEATLNVVNRKLADTLRQLAEQEGELAARGERAEVLRELLESRDAELARLHGQGFSGEQEGEPA